MDLINYLVDKFESGAAVAYLQAKSPLAVKVLEALAPSLPALCVILRDDLGITTIGGVDVGEFIEAMEKDLQEAK